MSRLISQLGIYGFGGTAPASGPWVPTDSADLQHWLDASDAATITATGNNLTSIADKSPNGEDFTAGNDPQTGTRTHNSLNVIDFDGVDQYIQNTNYVPASDFQHIMVYLIENVNDTGDGVMRIGGTSRCVLRCVSNSAHNTYLELFGSGNTSAGQAPDGQDVFRIVRHVFDFTTGEWKQYIDGALNLDNGSNLSTPFNNERFVYGSQHPSVGYGDVALGEAAIFENVGDTDGQKMEGYLADKWNITLDAGHPYAGGPP